MARDELNLAAKRTGQCVERVNSESSVKALENHGISNIQIVHVVDTNTSNALAMQQPKSNIFTHL